MKIWPRGFVSNERNKINGYRINILNSVLSSILPKLIVDLLIKNKDHSVHVIHTNEVRPPQVVLDKADHPTGSLVPSVVVRRPLAPVDLGHGGGQGHAPRPDQGTHRLILLLTQED